MFITKCASHVFSVCVGWGVRVRKQIASVLYTPFLIGCCFSIFTMYLQESVKSIEIEAEDTMLQEALRVSLEDSSRYIYFAEKCVELNFY